MKAGFVTSIRVRPIDCQGVLDVCIALGVDMDASFTQLTSTAFQSLLETARQNGLIPEPDPFAYANRMLPYRGGKNSPKRVRQLASTEAAGSELSVPALARPRRDFQPAASQVSPKASASPEPAAVQAVQATVVEVDEETLQWAQSRLTELLYKKDLAEDNPNVLWSQEDEREYQECFRIVYPAG